MVRKRRQRVARFMSTAVLVGTSAAVAGPVADSPHWSAIETYCLECHNATDWSGGVAFDVLADEEVPAEAAVWETTIRKLRGGLMPPGNAAQPDPETVKAVVSWLEGTLDAAGANTTPGYVPLRRLNRREYANAIRDLIGLEIDPAEWLPQDPLKEGFDTDAQLLQVTANFLDQSVAAARALALQAVGDPKSVPLETTYGNIANMIISLPPRAAPGSGNQQKYKDGMPFGTRGGMVVEHVFPADGEYILTIGDMALAREVPKMEFENTVIALLDGKEFYRTVIGGEEDHKNIDQNLDDAVFQVNSRLRNIRFHATAGQHKVAVTFLRRSYAESDERVRPNTLDGGQQRVPAVHALQIKGPVKVTGLSDSLSRRKIFICKPATPAEETPCAQRIIERLAERAFRRPVTEEDLRPLMAFYEKGRATGDFDTGIRDALSAILASPHFLYRAEAAAHGVRELTDLELASRMSFFLWSSLPDDELLTLAKNNELSKPGVLEAQVRRMLRDPRAVSLTKDFAFQWLNVAKMDTITPARAVYSHASGIYDPRPLFRKELELFIDSILRSDRSVVDLLTADHSYLNEQLALLYGMEDVKGGGFRKVTLKDPKRHGLLGKGAVLMLTANPDRTAPVLRGAWILERILAAPPAVPPPNVEQLPQTIDGRATTVRERTEIHRANPSCASCHAVMDPLGFALENFDTVGQFRTIDPQSGQPIDASATLPDGTPINGPEELARALAARSDQFVQAITEKLMTYAIGRHADHRDMPAVRRIVREAEASNYTFESIVLGVIKSESFRKRAAPIEEPGKPGTEHRQDTVSAALLPARSELPGSRVKSVAGGN